MGSVSSLRLVTVMHKMNSRIVGVAATIAMALTLHVTVEGVDVRVEHDKAFDFRPMKTWAWNPKPGDVMMARSQDDDPAAMKQRFEPVLMDAVATELPRRGLQQAASEPDLMLTYYVLLATNVSAQTMGQFLPATVGWGVPLFFAPTTQSLKVMNQGSLVLDFAAKGAVVWRGVADAKIDIGVDIKKREAVLREGVRDLLRRYPPKQ